MRHVLVTGALVLLAAGAPTMAAPGTSPDEPRGQRTLRVEEGPQVRVSVPRTAVAEQAVDAPALKPGFPVDMFFDAGSYMCCSSAALVGDVDGDPELEILASGLARGSTVAVDPDGSPLPGWPAASRTVEYLSLAELDPTLPGWEVVANEFDARITAYDVDGRPLPGWPRTLWGTGLHPAVPVDRDGDGIDEISLTHDDRTYWVLDAQGDPLHDGTWPRRTLGQYQQQAKPTVADLDGDGALEVLGGEAAERDSGDGNVWAWHADGTVMTGWPVNVPDFDHTRRIAVGDVSGDAAPEVVVEGHNRVEVLSRGGARLASWALPDPNDLVQMQHPALGDLDGDGDLEIVAVTSTRVHGYQGEGSPLPGWPRPIPEAQAGSFRDSSPVIGDLDNDGNQDVVVTGDSYGAPGLGVHGFDRTGTALPGFPLALATSSGWTPAIADIDGNGRSDLVVVGHHLENHAGHASGIFAFEYPTGQAAPPDWGQDAGGPHRTGTPRQSLRAAAEPSSTPGEPGPFRPVLDLRPGPVGSDPADLTVLGDAVVFTASSGATGKELWVSDGSAGGTRILHDIRPGAASSSPDRLTAVGDQVYFTANDGEHGREVWVTDGTAGGTRLVADVRAGAAGSLPSDLTALQDRLYFTARTSAGREIWVHADGATRLYWDGTTASFGTPSDDSSVRWLASTGTRLTWLSRWMDPSGVPHLWLQGSDGLSAQPENLLPDEYLAAGGRWPELVRGGVNASDDGSLVYRLDEMLVHTDGTLAGTRVIGDWGLPDHGFGEPSARGGDVLLAASWVSYNGVELYRGDGSQVADIDPGVILNPLGGERASGAPARLRPWQDGWFLSARTLSEGREPWWTDGTTEGTKRLADLATGSTDSNPVPLLDLGDRMLLRASTPGEGDEPWVLAPSGSAVRLADVAAGARGSHADEAVLLGDRIMLVLDDAAGGRELWTVRVQDVPVPGAPTPTPTPTTTPTTPTTPTHSPGPTTPGPTTPSPTTPSATPAPVVAPATTITRHPAARTTSRRARFRFRADQSGARFQCRLDGRRWRACSSPHTIRGLAVGRHVLRVRAISSGGVPEATPAIARWRVRSVGDS